MHSDFENLVIHNGSETYRNLSQTGRDVIAKITSVIAGLYGEDGEYPLDEFSFSFMGDDFLIFNRDSVYIKDIPVDTFTQEEIDWILGNLKIFNPEAGYIEPDYPVVSFTPLRSEEYLVWRVPNVESVLLGAILYDISDDINIQFVFHPRKDNLIITDKEMKDINNFIKEISQ